MDAQRKTHRTSGSAGNDDALIRAAYVEHSGAVLAYCTRLTGDRAAAEDVLQETMLRAWRRRDVLVNGLGSTRAWLLTVAHNLVVDRARARAARPREVAERPAAAPLTDDPADRVVRSRLVGAAVAGLSAEQRAVLGQLYYLDRTQRATASALDVPVGTVKSRAFTALRTLRAPARRPAC